MPTANQKLLRIVILWRNGAKVGLCIQRSVFKLQWDLFLEWKPKLLSFTGKPGLGLKADSFCFPSEPDGSGRKEVSQIRSRCDPGVLAAPLSYL